MGKIEKVMVQRAITRGTLETLSFDDICARLASILYS